VEEVMISTIDDGDVHVRVGESPSDRQATEPAADDHHVWRRVRRSCAHVGHDRTPGRALRAQDVREFATGWPIGSLAVMPTQLATILLADSDSGGGGGGAIAQLGILLLIPFAMYFFLIRPQRRRAREQQDVQKAIEIGDEIVTTSGIFGRVTGEDGPLRFWIEVDDDVQIRIARAAIQGKVGDEDEDKAGTAPAKGDIADSADSDLDS
jgi:preprotein translocase subunit YajC